MLETPSVLAPPPGASKAWPALEMVDEAFHRLRLAPPGVLGIYYVGTLPFILALLYFVADQSHGTEAASHATGGVLATGMLFLLMKVCHALFTARINVLLRREEDVAFTWTQLGRMAATQTILQPSGLFFVTLASVPLVPLPWVYAFYQNVTVLGDGTASTRSVLHRAAQAAVRWPRQNHLGLTVLGALGLFVVLDVVLALVGVPYLLRTFTGEENLFTRNGSHLFNTTFLAVVGALGYLVLDPVAKTFYTLRCFYEESVRSGDDLLSELATLPPVNAPLSATGGGEENVAANRAGAGRHGLTSIAVLVLAAAWSMWPVRAAAAAEAGAPVPSVTARVDAPGGGRAVSPSELGQSIHEVLGHRKFAWRTPRKELPAVDGPLDTFFKGLGHWLHEQWVTVSGWADAIGKWLRQWFKTRERPDDEGGSSGGILNATTMRALLIGLAAVLVGAILYVSAKELRRRRAGTVAGRAVPTGAVPVPDLRDDTVLATQLPEDEWLRLAQSLLQSGERRLALRAFYLSALSNLAGRGLLAIARHKSNRDYVAELRRRAREQPELQGAFARNVTRFERVWYGEHPADDGLLADFQADRQVG